MSLATVTVAVTDRRGGAFGNHVQLVDLPLVPAQCRQAGLTPAAQRGIVEALQQAKKPTSVLHLRFVE